jgi:hypothetical protein
MAYNVKTLAQPSVFWTNALWKAAGPLKEELYFLMDWDLWLRMIAAAESVAYIDSVLSYQRTQPQQKNDPNRRCLNEHSQERVNVAYLAARSRGESGLGWLVRVWWYRLRHSRGRFWMLRKPGFHWQVARRILKAVRE